MLRRFLLLLALAAGALVQTGADAQRERLPPYWVSLQASDALMRTGPGQNYPAVWRYVRRGLPMRVVQTQPNWRKLQDPEGATGWMLGRLLSEVRTGMVTGTEPRPMHVEPNEGARIRYRAEPGVVGRIEGCASGWCEFDVSGRRGFIRQDQLWGVDANERVD
jgi:SH3-like domain-containing protein